MDRVQRLDKAAAGSSSSGASSAQRIGPCLHGPRGLGHPPVAAAARGPTAAVTTSAAAAPRFAPAAAARTRVLAHAANDDDSLPEPKLGPNVAAGIRDVQRSLEWRTATVTRNDALNLDGGQRLLHLSVTDDVSSGAGLCEIVVVGGRSSRMAWGRSHACMDGSSRRMDGAHVTRTAQAHAHASLIAVCHALTMHARMTRPQVDKLYGRQMQGRNAADRWIDDYTVSLGAGRLHSAQPAKRPTYSATLYPTPLPTRHPTPHPTPHPPHPRSLASTSACVSPERRPPPRSNPASRARGGCTALPARRTRAAATRPTSARLS
jgi:hypothetical protein